MFDIIVICTGNRNRSPLAEAALRQVTQGLPVKVSSVGLLDLGCVPALPETLEVASRLGLDLSSHRSCSITEVDLSEIDLILGLEWQHVAAAVVDYGAPADRAFTLLEFSELVRELPPVEIEDPEERARTLVRAASDRKRASKRTAPGAPIHDPFGGPKEGFSEMAEIVNSNVLQIADKLFGVSRTPSAS